MFGTGNRFQVAKIGGVPIYASFSWLIIAALFSFSYYGEFEQRMEPNEAIQLTALFGVLFFGGILLHEGAHAIAARSFGLPVRGITLVFWGGATETRSWRKGPLADFVVAAAGPGTTALLGIGFLALAQQLDPFSEVRFMLMNLGRLNLFFAALNAVPGFPLDGGRMLMAGAWAITRNRATAQRVAGVGSMIVGGGFIAWAVVGLANGSPYSIFVGFIGFMIISVARQIPARAALRDKLLRGTARDALRSIDETIPANMTLLDVTERWLRSSPNRSFPVQENGHIVGTISLDDAAHTAAARPVREAMVPLDQSTIVEADEPLDDVVEWIGGGQALVVDSTGRTVGLLDVRDIDRWLRDHWSTGRFVERPVLAVPPRPDR